MFLLDRLLRAPVDCSEGGTCMRAARMYGYNQPLKLEDIPIPDIAPDEVLVKVGAAGMCRTDFQLVEGYFRNAKAFDFPLTPGHEIAGWIERIGSRVSKQFGLAEGDMIVVDGAWGDGLCRQCHEGNQQICAHGRWAGFGLHGGYQEYLPVPCEHVIKVASPDLTPEVLAPLTDAGVTPYRGVKKLAKAGVLGPGRTIAVLGIGGLGAYAVQYAKLLGAGATVVALARTADKLALATRNGADVTINTRDRSEDDVRAELAKLTGRGEVDGIIDCVGAEATIRLGFALLATEGAFVSVGLVGEKIEIPLFPFVAREFSYHGSFWANYNDVTEVIALAQRGLVKHSIQKVAFEDINECLQQLGKGDILGRAVIVYE
jgi:propanol-preferring alcohol dehydrogenase